MTEAENDCKEAEEIERVVEKCTTDWTVPVYESAEEAVNKEMGVE